MCWTKEVQVEHNAELRVAERHYTRRWEYNYANNTQPKLIHMFVVCNDSERRGSKVAVVPVVNFGGATFLNRILIGPLGPNF
jgi:hypothetical protein